MTTTTTTPVTTDSATECEPLDLRTRLVLFGAGGVAALVLAAIGLTVFIMVINNWNFLNWME